jgi:NTE family protein
MENCTKQTYYDTLVLSGGGVKGFSILGAVQSALDMNLLTKIKFYIGTSIGAIISYLLAIGYTPIEIICSVYSRCWMEKIHNFNLVAMLNGSGASSFTPVYEVLEKLTLEKIGHFLTLKKLKEDFGRSLICVTYNMTTCCTEYLGPDNYPDLPCLTALKMSANIPLIFDRFKYMDNYYIDGGITDHFPILKGENLGEKILGIFASVDNDKSLKDDPDDGILIYFFRLLRISTIQSVRYRNTLISDKCTVVELKITLKNFLEFDVKSKQRLDMFSEGYNQFKQFLNSENKFFQPINE